MHLLVWLEEPYKIRTPEDVDETISAEIPDKDRHPRLHELVTSMMLHGPCNQRCLVNGKCSKHFPKDYQENTQFSDNGYPQYQRHNNGVTFRKNQHIYTNRLVLN